MVGCEIYGLHFFVKEIPRLITAVGTRANLSKEVNVFYRKFKSILENTILIPDTIYLHEICVYQN